MPPRTASPPKKPPPRSSAPTAPAPMGALTRAMKGQSQEARAVLLFGEGNQVKGKNLANKAMANYLLDDRIDDAQRCANMVAED